VKSLTADRNDPAAVGAALAGTRFDAVFDNVYDWQRGTTADHVVATALACGGRLHRYVFMSSVAAYGDGLCHREDDALAPDNHPDAYARNKAMTERALFRLHQQRGLPVVTLRPSYVYGPRNAFYREAFFWDRLRRRRPILLPADGNRLMQFVYVKDLVAACLRALEKPAAVAQAFNVADSRPVTQRELVAALSEAAGKAPQVVHVPRSVLRAAGANPVSGPLYFGEYFDLPPITMSTQKAQRVLAWQPAPFDTGLKETYRWYARNQPKRKLDFAFEDALIAASAKWKSNSNAAAQRRS
jgi:nucleoside-diphosphate-sugar epimerase